MTIRDGDSFPPGMTSAGVDGGLLAQTELPDKVTPDPSDSLPNPAGSITASRFVIPSGKELTRLHADFLTDLNTKTNRNFINFFQ